MSEPSVGRHYRDDDWYGEDLGAARFERCTFTDVDLSEVSTGGAVFDQCTFHGGRFNASTHLSSAFVACDFRRTSFFDATFEGCKMLGSVFADCTLRPMRVVGGQWHVGPGGKPELFITNNKAAPEIPVQRKFDLLNLA